MELEELAWQARVFGSIRCDGFRLSKPLPARDGWFVVDGWCAREYLLGEHENRRWADIIAVGEQFHAALSGASRPHFILKRTDPWAIGDRVAWGAVISPP